MTARRFGVVCAIWLSALAALAGQSAPAPYVWTIPTNFPRPRVPASNPMSDAKVELGRYLFYDTRLSANGTQSCATCHKQELAFTDGRGQSLGSTGQVHPRGSMSLVNIAYASTLTWANPTMTRLEDQAHVPMYGTKPIELGLPPEDDALTARLDAAPPYRRLFQDAFGASGRELFSSEHVTQAIAAFERTIVSARSPYDRYHNDRDNTAISDAARRGETLFFSNPLSCFRCHGGPTFSGGMDYEGRPETGVELHNTGLYNIPGPISFPPQNTGAYEFTGNPDDVGRFKAPTLRNIAVTAPYMHDGSIATLEEVIAHSAAGGRTIADGPNKGVGHDNPHKSPSVHGFAITTDQRDDLVAFLRSLTDDALLHDPRFSNPWTSTVR